MMHKISFSYKTTCANCHMPSRHWKQLMPHCSKQNSLQTSSTNKTAEHPHGLLLPQQSTHPCRSSSQCNRTCSYKPTATAYASECSTPPHRGPQHSWHKLPVQNLCWHFDDKPGPCPKNWTLQKIFALLTQAAFFESLLNFSLNLTVFAGGASRLQACINAVELAIIANSIALDHFWQQYTPQEYFAAPNDDDAWKRTTERTLSAPWMP